MQAQAYEGYIENGHIYTQKKNLPITGRKRVIIAIPDEPEDEFTENSDSFFIEYKHLSKEEDMERRLAWLDRLDKAMELACNEELVYIPRSDEMRKPTILTD